MGRYTISSQGELNGSDELTNLIRYLIRRKIRVSKFASPLPPPPLPHPPPVTAPGEEFQIGVSSVIYSDSNSDRCNSQYADKK